ncbi:MAG: type IX secretion system membrane protein PorP/SprF, partial [Bacteroidota bacterium]
MTRKLLNLLSLPILCLSLTLGAQDVHFSHIHASPTLLNPSMTGLINGDLRLIANTRSQWQSVTRGCGKNARLV